MFLFLSPDLDDVRNYQADDLDHACSLFLEHSKSDRDDFLKFYGDWNAYQLDYSGSLILLSTVADQF